ncbi:hypothetical protein CLHOM_06190 [Clostridium homopropionicum DSM 5847]|uniref:Sulfotransferase family protein n=1 Tax=Clostridium homopropionicum DSM 5847 TaxID=1121318 RepID=A0A0L6ZDH9_9CLOT|nr:sulfotransferase [Clostridium homopropionicum]KOA21031.1 hypothetical protein CLHOM_06190 [Clostridium homopropionicum DSM 5847]SFF98984.1 hypothetical protein SAMN04488501_104101 [Clostridium homopropionicum]
MKKSIFINAMSRNGSSLIFQLLAGHKSIFLYPPRVEVACSKPRGWPFFGFEKVNAYEFWEVLSKKHFTFVGDKWYNLQRKNILDDENIDYFKLKNNVLDLFQKIGTNVTKDNLYKFFNAYCEGFINLYSQSCSEQYCNSKYIVYQDDHLYNFGPQSFCNCKNNAYFIQVIRNYIDVIASRKNMLLHHLKYIGDPKNMTLKKEVIDAELTRCFWNIICAHLNYEFNDQHYIVLKFENLHNDRLNSMLHVCNKLNIEFDDILLEETKTKSDILVMNGLLLTESSLAKVSDGKSNDRINSYNKTLNEDEINNIKYIEKGFNYIMPLEVDELNFYNEIERFYKLNVHEIENNHILSRWVSLYNENRFDIIMEEYSSLNYGSANAKEAFVI